MSDTHNATPPDPQKEAVRALVANMSPDQILLLAKAFDKTTEKPAPTGMSADVTLIAGALAMAKGQMFSPTRNKHVTVKPRRGGPEYSFRYSSLDVINDMLRLPLFENGLSILHQMRPMPNGSLFLVSRLLHKSGQYIDSVLPIFVKSGGSYLIEDQEFSGPHKMGSAMAYARRYNICALMDIASQEDDDGNLAEGNVIIDHEYPVEPNAKARAQQDRYARLIAAAANALDPAGVGEMLKMWQRGSEFWHQMRLEGDIEGWNRLMELIPAAIDRVHSPLLAGVFRIAATATQAAQLDEIRATWDTPEGVEARANMKALNQSSYGMLFEHLRVEAARVEREEELAEIRRQKEAERAAQLLAVQNEGSPFEGAKLLLEAPIAAVEPAPVDLDPVETLPDQSYRQVRDEFGEINSDVCATPIDWAKAFVTQFQMSENRVAVLEHNADGLKWVEISIDAKVILFQGLGKDLYLAEEEAPPALPEDKAPSDLVTFYLRTRESEAPVATTIQDLSREEPTPTVLPTIRTAMAPLPPANPDEPELPLVDDAPTAVLLHKNARGQWDLGRYLRAIVISLGQTETDQLEQWESTNLPTIDTLPRGTQMEILGALARRKQTLGIGMAA